MIGIGYDEDKLLLGDKWKSSKAMLMISPEHNGFNFQTGR